MGKVQSFLGEVSVSHVCKLNTIYTIKFFKCSAKKILPNVYQKMFLII